MKRLKELREAYGLSQRKLASHFHLSQQSIFKYEHDLAEPDISMLKSLANFFDVSVDYLIEYKDETSCEISTTSYHPTSTEHRLLSYFKKLSPNLQNIIFDLVQESALSPKEREEMETDDNETIESNMFEESCSISEENKNDETEK